MAKREIHRLSALEVGKISQQGRFADGGGLYLQVGPSGNKSWLYRYMLDGKARQMGLGAVDTYSLKEAREKAHECRKQHADGIDPIEHRKAERQKRRLDAVSTMTFKECAKQYITSHQSTWKNPKHSKQWTSTLETYAYPTIGSLSIQAVDTSHILQILEPIWQEKSETASRVRGRMEAILDWATAREYRKGENPARWKGHIDKILPAKTKVKKPKHHAALPFDEIGKFMKSLNQRESVSARGLEFLILTASRTSEVMGADWSEVDLDNKVWTIPAERMKAKKDHRVPLTDEAMDILRRMKEVAVSDYVFPGTQKNRSLSNMAFLQLLKRMDRGDLTAHGFRSTFRDWCSERTNYPNHVAEMALAHTIESKVEAAYRRGDLFEKRRRLMRDWAVYCRTVDAAQPSDNVHSISRASS